MEAAAAEQTEGGGMRPNPSESDLDQYLENLSRRNKVSGVGVRPQGSTARFPRDGAGSTPAHPSPRFNGYRSKLESAWANYLQGLWMLKAVSSWWYEPVNLRLPGKKNFYKPDFLVQTESGLTFYEVKGRNKSDDRSLVKMKTAAGLTPWAKFVLVKRIKGQWEERHIV